MLVADLDLQLIDMCTGQRWLRGRRPELYASLTQRRGDELGALQARFSVQPTHAQPALESNRP